MQQIDFRTCTSFNLEDDRVADSPATDDQSEDVSSPWPQRSGSPTLSEGSQDQERDTTTPSTQQTTGTASTDQTTGTSTGLDTPRIRSSRPRKAAAKSEDVDEVDRLLIQRLRQPVTQEDDEDMLFGEYNLLLF
jgi:hypothetical protein